MADARGFEGMGVSAADLDRYITGGYGEDQYDYEDDEDSYCPDCDYLWDDCTCGSEDDWRDEE